MEAIYKPDLHFFTLFGFFGLKFAQLLYRRKTPICFLGLPLLFDAREPKCYSFPSPHPLSPGGDR